MPSEDRGRPFLRACADLWFDVLVRQRFLLGPLWESRREDAFDQLCYGP